jgi:RNA polymerase sigma factor (sigma-70 family)
MLNRRRAGWFLDLDRTCDEVLLLLAREARYRAAGDELTCRYWRHFKTRLRRWPARARLTCWDVEDAQQQAYFWIREAIEAYDSRQLAQPAGSSFRTFLQRVLRLRLLDFCRSLRRNRNRYLTAAEPEQWRTAFVDDRHLVAGNQEELHPHLASALSALDPPARALWNEMRSGKRLCDLAATLGVSYRTLKRRWHNLRKRLASTLRQLRHCG